MVLPLDDGSRPSSKPALSGPPRKGPSLFFIPIIPAPQVAVDIRGRSYTIEAKVKIESTEYLGVIFAPAGTRCGGHSLFIGKDDGASEAVYIFLFLGIEQQEFVSRRGFRTRTQRQEYTFVVEFNKI